MTRRIAAGVADSGPVLVLAAIAAAGSFTHIRDTATEHGQGDWMAWAIAVCIDLTCVMAARERHRDQRTGRATGRLSWPTLVLVGGILLSLAANLAQADPNAWGWITAGTPAAAFLVAVSMLERRSSGAGSAPSSASAATSPAPDTSSASGLDPSSSGALPASSSGPASSPWVVWDQTDPDVSASDRPVPGEQADQNGHQDDQGEQDGQTVMPVPSPAPASCDADTPAPPSASSAASSGVGPLVEFAWRVATEHHSRHGRPITRDALRARLGVSNQLASDLLRQIRTEPAA